MRVLSVADPSVGGDTAVSSLSGNSLRPAASFDDEACDTYTIRVWSLDQEGLWFEKDFSIAVIDVNEAP